jgi:hypothetical protein
MSAAVKESSREPTGTVTAEPARIKLQPLGTPLRALARAHTDGRLVLEAELPWLQLGADCTAELHDGRSIDGKVHWIGLDMTRSGTARLRILVDTHQAKSIQLSVHDADVEELRPPPSHRPRWLWPVVTVLLAATAGWLASRAMTPKQEMMTQVEAPVAERSLAPPPIVRIPAESLQLPSTGEVAVVVPMVAPAMPQLGVPSLTPPAAEKPAAATPATDKVAKKSKPANRAAASRSRRSSKP